MSAMMNADSSIRSMIGEMSGLPWDVVVDPALIAHPVVLAVGDMHCIADKLLNRGITRRIGNEGNWGIGHLNESLRGKYQPYQAAAVLSSLSAPRITILSASSGSGRCSALASSHGARIHTSRSSSMVRIDPGKKVLFQFFHLCRQIGISANSVGGILARQDPDVVIRL